MRSSYVRERDANYLLWNFRQKPKISLDDIKQPKEWWIRRYMHVWTCDRAIPCRVKVSISIRREFEFIGSIGSLLIEQRDNKNCVKSQTTFDQWNFNWILFPFRSVQFSLIVFYFHFISTGCRSEINPSPSTNVFLHHLPAIYLRGIIASNKMTWHNQCATEIVIQMVFNTF